MRKISDLGVAGLLEFVLVLSPVRAVLVIVIEIPGRNVRCQAFNAKNAKFEHEYRYAEHEHEEVSIHEAT